ncbi:MULTISPECIES: hypothetical protein [Empedobacter]|uniref:hypothetical protein n=1 Tax=Empedobacter TaxID=59734 RepID=UPI001C57DE05|nr:MULTISPECIES: hypothetical protein [Empedobacter]MBW1618298.1 hypothetical protein [Empedobacter falsenii]MDH0658762.1 hypothetical protein [Empedobacter sp. GD03865]MDM1039934.1 hypothetical protein [Empedobacter brevis]MDM1133866.1 hypothetical protein [Empedobacter sp. R750]
MKKIIFLAMLTVSSISLTSCVNNDDGYYDNGPEIVNVGQINYDGVSFPLRNAVVADIEKADGGYYYSVELSTNPVPKNGKLYGSYLYLEIFQRGDLNFNGTYVTENNDRGLDYIEYYEDPIMQNYVPVLNSGTFALLDTDFSSGSINLKNYFDPYNRSLLSTNFALRVSNGKTLTGDFDGLFDFIQLYNKSAKGAVNAKSATTERVKTGVRRPSARK